jgi:hypothetical protein
MEMTMCWRTCGTALLPFAAKRTPLRAVLVTAVTVWLGAPLAYGQVYIDELPSPLKEDILELKKLSKGPEPDVDALEAVGSNLLKKYTEPKDQAEVYFHLALSYLTGPAPRPEAIIANAKNALDLPLAQDRRLLMYSYMGDAELIFKRDKDISQRLRLAAEYYLAGLEDLNELNRPATPPKDDKPREQLRIEQRRLDAERARTSVDYKQRLEMGQKRLVSKLALAIDGPKSDPSIEGTIQSRLEKLENAATLKQDLAAALEKRRAARVKAQANAAAMEARALEKATVMDQARALERARMIAEFEAANLQVRKQSEANAETEKKERRS